VAWPGRAALFPRRGASIGLVDATAARGKPARRGVVIGKAGPGEASQLEWKVVGQSGPDLGEGVAHALLTSAAKPILLEAAA
jgi:hypothetical protein